MTLLLGKFWTFLSFFICVYCLNNNNIIIVLIINFEYNVTVVLLWDVCERIRVITYRVPYSRVIKCILLINAGLLPVNIFTTSSTSAAHAV